MAFGPRLELRQSQSLVMTPQLLQAIKLLQLSTVELSAYVENELERNPLLERAETSDAPERDEPSEPADRDTREEGDWAAETMGDRAGLETDLGTDFTNSFPDDAPARPEPARPEPNDSAAFGAFETGMRGGGGFDPNSENGLEGSLVSPLSLHDELERQLGMTVEDPVDQLIGRALIAAIEGTGYLAEPTEDVAERLGVPNARVERILAAIHTFEPAGVGARTLAECLAIQLRERNRLDPAMEALLANLDLLAKRDFAGLRKLCRVDDEDLADMVGEIRRLDPKPGLAHGTPGVQAVIPDVILRGAPDGSWLIELNSEALPKVLANRAYFTRVSKHATQRDEKLFVEEAWTNANWLVRSLEQRSRTILKVASEIVRQQDGFFAYGVTQLRPLNLKAIAEVVQLHESTVSRVTSNKYMATPRGIFEMKYFFTASIAGVAGGDAHSAEAVRFRIRQLIESEGADSVLSDDAIVDRLNTAGIDIARRTVAKYRESMRIPSSSARRREKRTFARV